MNKIFFILIVFLYSCKCKDFGRADKLIVHYSKYKDTIYIYDNPMGKKVYREYILNKCPEVAILFCCVDEKGKLRSPAYQKKIWDKYIAKQ